MGYKFDDDTSSITVECLEGEIWNGTIPECLGKYKKPKYIRLNRRKSDARPGKEE